MQSTSDTVSHYIATHELGCTVKGLYKLDYNYCYLMHVKDQ